VSALRWRRNTSWIPRLTVDEPLLAAVCRRPESQVEEPSFFTSIARLPRLHRAAAGTFDILIDTVLGCQSGRPPTRLRMPAAVIYSSSNCIGDCDGDNQVRIEELTLGVSIALGEQSSGHCLALDPDGDGNVEVFELIGSVRSALEGCGD
jgi:hypothetical protein